jgi:exodeoxyribonuclease V alpha subunit
MSRQISFIKDWFELGREGGWIETSEMEMLRFLEKEYGELSDEIRMCTVFVSLFIKAGHTCLPLDYTPQKWVEILGLDVDKQFIISDRKVDVSSLKSSTIVGLAGDMKPLILSKNRLTFRRYWYYEYIAGQWIKRNSSNKSLTGISRISVEILDGLFPYEENELNWQKTAAALSLIKPFLIISGGPGTGKTTTVARILALHQRVSDEKLNIALAAPTGKAAGRMGEALSRELEKLNLSQKELRDFPKEAKTVHRLLSGTESRGLLPPVEKKLLRQDLIIIDEASMMDLSLMYRLVNHLSETTRLILLGDKDQLASVEAGSVFSDLCQKNVNGFLSDTIQSLKMLGIKDELPKHDESEISDSIVYLTKSYRFDESSGIGKLSDLVKNQNKETKNLKTVFDGYSDLHCQNFAFQKMDIQYILEDLKQKIKNCSDIQTPQEILEFWKKSAWLMVLRKGLTGTERLNRLIEQQLAADRVVQMENSWYHGRPIIVTQNDYSLGVFNGDLGVTIVDRSGSRWVYIETGSEIKRYNPQRLSHFEPAYFLTVHKSQGSEFNHVHFLLPQKDTPILTKELIYTVITRARENFSLYGNLDLFEKGMKRETVRFTGLKDLLYS